MIKQDILLEKIEPAISETAITTKKSQIEPVRRAWIESVTLLQRYKWFIIITTLAVTIGTAVFLFGFAKLWYKAEANIVPARKLGGGMLESLTSGLSSTIKDLGITPLAGMRKGEGVYSPLALISSRQIQEKLVREFGFVKIYEAPTMEDAVKEFGSHVSADILEEGNISVSFEDTDPKRAADVANRL